MHCEISLGRATSNAITGHTTPADAIADIQSGKWAKEIAALRNASGDEADKLKKTLPAILWAGKFTSRKNGGIEKFSGYLCADIDKVPKRIGELHDTARNDPHAAAAFVSPSGTGIKIVFRVPVAADAKQHQHNFNAVRAHVAKIYNAKVDEAAKDIARLCFVSNDPAAFYNAEAVPLDVTSEPAAVASVQPLQGAAKGGTSNRTEIAKRILGAIQWTDDTTGFCKCPGEHLHTTANSAKDCKVMLDGVPTIKCFHGSCAGIVAGANHELRSQIAKAEKPTAPDSNRADVAREYLGDEPEADQAGLPPIVDAADFMATPHPQPRELVCGILHQGSKLVLGGGSKSFKTWTLLDLALSVAHGLPWFGRDTICGRVLYINFEIQDYAWEKRIAAVARAKGIELKPDAIKLWNLRGHAADFKTLLPQVTAQTKEAGFALIILDPIYKLYGRTDENKAGDVAALLNGIESLAVQTGAAIAFGAHFSKGNQSQKEAIDRISGSGVFARDPDSILIFTRHEEQDAFTVESILRNFPPVDPFAVRWNFPLFELADELDPAKLKQAGGRKAENAPDDLLKLLPADGLTNAAFLAAADEDGISKRTFYRLRKSLEKAGRIMLSKVTGKWTPISPKNKP